MRHFPDKPAKPVYIWQLAAWPAWEYDLAQLAAPLAQARLQLGRAIGKAQAIGLAALACLIWRIPSGSKMRWPPPR